MADPAVGAGVVHGVGHRAQPRPQWVGLANYAAVLADPCSWPGCDADARLHGDGGGAEPRPSRWPSALLLDSGLHRPRPALFKVRLPAGRDAGRRGLRRLALALRPSFGAVNAALDRVGLPAFGGLTTVDTATTSILIAELWHHAGFYMVIFLANLAIRDPRSTKRRRSTAPAPGTFATSPAAVRPALLINSVYALIQFLKTFTVVVVMTKGGPADSTNFVSYYAYQLFDQGRYGEATAMATILFAIVIVLALAGLCGSAGAGGR